MRFLLKLSGEALKNETSPLNTEACTHIAKEIAKLHSQGAQIGVVLGGGNIFRGHVAKELGFSRTSADHIGMLATCINALYLAQALQTLNCKATVMSSLPCPTVAETFNHHKALQYLQDNYIVIFAGGTGNPYFTTDSAAALKASEINANFLLKATKVDGVYDKDPMKYPDAKKYPNLSYEDAFVQNLQVMDATAIALCRENHIPIYVFNLFKEESLIQAALHQKGGSLVTE